MRQRNHNRVSDFREQITAMINGIQAILDDEYSRGDKCQPGDCIEYLENATDDLAQIHDDLVNAMEPADDKEPRQ